MKVTVTHMKAPWPAGAVVGSVVEVPGDAVPAWAVGKCTPAGDDVEAAFVWTPPPPLPEQPEVDPAALADRLKLVEAQRDAALAKVAELQAAVDAAAAKGKAK